MSRWSLSWLLAIPFAVLCFATLTLTAPRNRDKDYQLVRTFVDVLNEVDQHYVRPLNDEQKRALVEDMINEGLGKLDPYSGYMNDKELKRFETQTEGNFGGVGIQITQDLKTGLLMVTSPMPGTPAFDAGIQAGDFILKIDDKSAEGITIDEALPLITGEPGTKVNLTVVSEGDKKERTVTLTRAKISVKTVYGYERLPNDLAKWNWFVDRQNGIGYIRVLQFTDPTLDDLKQAIEELEKAGAKALILDLRGNPGGLLTSAIDVSDLFLTKGKIVSTKDRNGRGRSWDAKESDTMFEPANERPMVVLVDRMSASASEIVSAALQDNNRAIVVGERSYGKGSVQKIIRLNSEPPTAVKLTTDTYWRPSEKNIHRYPDMKETDEWGVSPNEGFLIEMDSEERLGYLRYQRAKDIVQKNNKVDVPHFTDRVLELAQKHLREKLGVK